MALESCGRILRAIVAISYLWLLVHAQVNPVNIVPDVNADCPVSNTLYTEDQFTVSRLYALMTPLVTSGTAGSKCAAAVPGMTVCAADGTLQIKEGCCSVACAGKMQQALLSTGPGCYREFIEVMCNTTEIREGISFALFNAARRCMGLSPACDLLMQPGNLLNATATTAAVGNASAGNASAANATAANSSDVNAPAASIMVVSTYGNASRSAPTGAQAAANATRNIQAPVNATRSSTRPRAVSTTHSSNGSTVTTANDTRPGPPGPDPFMPLVPQPPLESVALATPDEIDQAAGDPRASRASSNSTAAAADLAGTGTNVTAATAAAPPSTASQGVEIANRTAGNSSSSSPNQAAAPKLATSAGSMHTVYSMLALLAAHAALAVVG